MANEWQQLATAYDALPDVRRVAAIELLRILAKIGPNATEMLLDVARGHEIGVSYGDWENAALDYVSEAREESRDAVNYLSAEMRRLAAVIKARTHFAIAHQVLVEAGKI